MLIPEEKVQEILERTDIAALVARSVELKRAGRSLKGLCPFHGERTPSFTVSPERRRYKCFGCGAGGDAISFVMQREGKGFAEAARALASECGVQLTEGEDDRLLREKLLLRRVNELAANFYAQQLWDRTTGVAARAHLKGRGLNGEAAKRFGLGFAPAAWSEFAKRTVSAGMFDAALGAGLVAPRKATSGTAAARPKSGDGGAYDFFRGRLMIPVRNAEGATVAFGGRTLPLPGLPADDRKFVNSRESIIYRKGELLFAIDLAKDAIRKTGQALLVEGYFDAIALHMAGITNAVALCSASLTAEQIKLLRRFDAKELVLILDGDDAGRRGVDRAAGALLASAMPTRVMVLPQGRDPDEHVLAVGSERFRAEVAAALPLTEHLVAMALPQREKASFEQKLKAIAELRPTVALVPEGLERSLLISALSRGLGVSEDDLSKSLQGKAPSAKRSTAEPAPVARPAQRPASSERNDRRLFTEELLLLAHLLHDPELSRLPQSQELEAIEHLGLRAMASEVMEGVRDGHPLVIEELLSSLAAPIRSQLLELLDRVRQQTARAHREEFIQKCALHRDHLQRREEEQLQQQLRTLATEIAVLRKSASPDDPSLHELLEEHVRLTELKRSLTAVHRPRRTPGSETVPPPVPTVPGPGRRQGLDN